MRFVPQCFCILHRPSIGVDDWNASYHPLCLWLYGALHTSWANSWLPCSMTLLCSLSSPTRLWFSVMWVFSVTVVETFTNRCDSQRAAVSYTPLVSYPRLEAYSKPRINIGSNESNIWDLLCICRPLAHLGAYERLGYHNETTYPQGDVFCNRGSPGRGRWESRLPETLHRCIVGIFRGGQSTSNCSCWTLLLYSTGRVAYAPISHPLLTPFPSDCCTSLLMT